MNVFVKSKAIAFGKEYERGNHEMNKTVYKQLVRAGKVDPVEEEMTEESPEVDPVVKRIESILEKSGIDPQEAKQLSVSELVSIDGIGKKSAERFLEAK